MGFDLDAAGESFGDINEIFFKKDGKSLTNDTPTSGGEKVSLNDISKQVAETSKEISLQQHSQGKHANGSGATIINISKDVIGGEDDVQIILDEQEERRMNTTSVRNKNFIDINSGEMITIVEKTEMYNGVNLYTAKKEDGKLMTYPRSLFVGKNKQFVPKEFYIREAERAIEDTIEKFYQPLFEILKNNKTLEETSDGIYLEYLLDEPIDIIGGIVVPDKIQIPVKRLFDMEYKIMMLENVICLDNKIASLLFVDIWF
jgi:hypothetical protein